MKTTCKLLAICIILVSAWTAQAACTVTVNNCADLILALQSASNGDTICIGSSITCDAATVFDELRSTQDLSLPNIDLVGTASPRAVLDWAGANNGFDLVGIGFDNLVVQGAADCNIRYRNQSPPRFMRNMLIQGSGDKGIQTYDSRSALLWDNCEFITNAGIGLDLRMHYQNQQSNTVTDCTFQGNLYGVYGNGVYLLDMQNCDFTQNYIALRWSGTPAMVDACNFIDNGWQYHPTGIITNCDNHPKRGHAVTTFSSGAIVTNCLFEDNDGHGIKAPSVDSLIEDNTFIYRAGSDSMPFLASCWYSNLPASAIDSIGEDSVVRGNVFFCLDNNRAISAMLFGSYYPNYGAINLTIDHNTMIGSPDLSDCANNNTGGAVTGASVIAVTGTFSNNIVVGFGGCASLPVTTQLSTNNNDFYGNGDNGVPADYAAVDGNITDNPALASLDPANSCGAYLSCATPAAVLNGDTGGLYMGALYVCPDEINDCCDTCAVWEELALDALCSLLAATPPSSVEQFAAAVPGAVPGAVAGRVVCSGDPAGCIAQVIANIQALP